MVAPRVGSLTLLMDPISIMLGRALSVVLLMMTLLRSRRQISIPLGRFPVPVSLDS